MHSDEVVHFPEGEVQEIERARDLLKELPLKALRNSFPLPSYERIVSEAIADMRRGFLDKVVLSRFVFTNHALTPEWLDHLKWRYPNAFVALIHSELSGTWILASPEQLLACDQGMLQSSSLAGTARRFDALQRKENEEQKIVTDYICEVLNKYAQDVEVGDRQIKGSGDLLHLHNRISAKLKEGKDATELIKALHPTPAVGGKPLKEALEFIHDTEGYERSFYTGFLGYSSGDSFDLYVNLRSAQCYSNGTTYYAGAGITADSNPTKEWEETQAKLRVLKSVLLSPSL